MGFRTALEITFGEGHEFHGLEVTARRLSIGRVFDAQELLFGAELTQDTPRAERQKWADELVDVLASSITEWNVEDDDGVPVPADRDGLAGRDLRLLQTLLVQLFQQSKGVASDSPLGGGLPSGGGSVEASIPMETP